MRVKRSLQIVMFGFLLSLLVFFQNCTGCVGNAPAKFTSETKSENSSGSGNGEPYEAKPDPGTYFRVAA